ncbi:MAG: phosphopantothenoylcysteine decarboxylase, partial [Gemmatimonadales bacterium]
KGALSGRRVLVSAGTSREGLDAVRVITNLSSGLMGFELAREAYARGAEVILVTGPTTLDPPYGVDVVRIDSTEELQSAISSHLKVADVLVMAAAPSDYRPTNKSAEKRARKDGSLGLELEPTPDVLESTLSDRPERCFCVGFALETGDGLKRAREKMTQKQLDMVVYNRADQNGSGFEVETNQVILITDSEEEELPLMTKSEVAAKILDAVEARV